MLKIDVDDAIATITIMRGAKANSLPQEGKALLASSIGSLDADPSVAAMVITGEGSRAFCAGSAIDEMQHFSMTEMDRMLHDERALYMAALTADKPVIAAVNGYALGAGLILAMSCDYAVASSHAEFGAPELQIGVAAPLEGLLLPYFVGLARARAMFFTGERLDASTARSVGLVNEVVEGPSLLERATAVARKMAALPADGFKLQKKFLHQLVSTGNLEAAIQTSHHLTSRQFSGPEVSGAMAAFLSRHRTDPAVDATARPSSDKPEVLLADEDSEWLRTESAMAKARAERVSGSAAWTEASE